MLRAALTVASPMLQCEARSETVLAMGLSYCIVILVPFPPVAAGGFRRGRHGGRGWPLEAAVEGGSLEAVAEPTVGRRV